MNLQIHPSNTAGAPGRARSSAERSLLDRFLTAKEAAGLAVATLDWYGRFLAQYTAFCADSGLEPAEADTVDGFLAYLRRRGNSPETARGAYRALSTYFGWLVKRGLLERSPMAGVQKPKRPVTPRPFVTYDDFRKILGAIPTDTWSDCRDRALLVILFFCGLRASEALNLRAEDIDRERQVLTVRRGKGGKARLVPVTPDVLAAVDRYLALRPTLPSAPAALFWSSNGSAAVRGRLSGNGLRHMLERRCAAVDLRYYSPHAFRHGFAMTMLDAGMPMSAISVVMGHASVTVTESTYARWQPAGLTREYKAARARLDQE